MTKQELYVINSLTGKPAELVANIMAILPELITAVEESGWISVDERLPEFGEVVLIFCANASYKHDGLKQTVATYSSAQEIFDCSECYDDISECSDAFVAEVSLFDSEYGGRYLNEDVTHCMPLPEPPKEQPND